MRNHSKTLFKKIILPTTAGIALGEAAYAYHKGTHYNGFLEIFVPKIKENHRVWRYNKKHLAIAMVVLLLLYI